MLSNNDVASTELYVQDKYAKVETDNIIEDKRIVMALTWGFDFKLTSPAPCWVTFRRFLWVAVYWIF